MKPTRIQKSASEIVIDWNNGTTQKVPLAMLREKCSCAVCREGGVPTKEAGAWYERACQLQGLNLVGNYAIQLIWGDGHRSISAFDRIAEYRDLPS